VVELEVIVLLFQEEQKLSLTGGTSFPITVGAGGAGGLQEEQIQVILVRILQYFQQLHQQVEVEVEKSYIGCGVGLAGGSGGGGGGN
jgi:hypothetical protein